MIRTATRGAVSHVILEIILLLARCYTVSRYDVASIIRKICKPQHVVIGLPHAL